MKFWCFLFRTDIERLNNDEYCTLKNSMLIGSLLMSNHAFVLIQVVFQLQSSFLFKVKSLIIGHTKSVTSVGNKVVAMEINLRPVGHKLMTKEGGYVDKC